MHRTSIILLMFLLQAISIFAQKELKDSILLIPEVEIKAYFDKQPLSSAAVSAAVIEKEFIEKAAVHSLVPAMNSISGVRMEERSPASYRLSIRGSSLRSPFGVRNVKIYLDELPLTDAGGNTYLNLIAHSGIEQMEILKGPDASLFGANSGGVLLIQTAKDTSQTSMGLGVGSYGLFSHEASFARVKEKFTMQFHHAYQKSDGYRNHSAMQRFYFHNYDEWKYAKNAKLGLTAFYSALHYETPGGLTEEQFKEDASQSRPATLFTPSAEEQEAGIYNNSIFAGLKHEWKLHPRIKHFVSFSGMLTDFKNPFITNYELRDEKSHAFRSYLQWMNKNESKLKLQFNTGWEYQKTFANIRNYENNNGEKGSLFSADNLINVQHFWFNRLYIQLWPHWKAEASLSINNYSFEYADQQAAEKKNVKRKFETELMPRFALSYLFNNSISFRGIISKGFSPPSTAELRASDTQINPFLQAEKGWNKELGIRYTNPSNSFYMDYCMFHYRMQDAIVRRLDSMDRDYFINAGSSLQKGMEVMASYSLKTSDLSFVKEMRISSGISLYDFYFEDYQVEDMDFSGNEMTGVPQKNVSSSVWTDFRIFSIFVQYQYVSSIYLNDANTMNSEAYNLLQCKVEKSIKWRKSIVKIYFVADNLMNEKYSLGNDINAYGARYFNAAADRSFFAGLKISL